MHRTTIIFSDSLWREINRCKRDESASDYVRVAVLARIFYEKGLAKDSDMEDALAKAREALDQG